MAKSMGPNNKRTNNKTIFPKYQGKTNEKNSSNTQLNCNSDSPRENKRLSPQI